MKYSIPTYMDVFYLYQTLFNVKFETNIYYNLIKRKTLNWLFEYGISKKKLLQLQLETHLLKTKTEIFELQYEILTEFENVISKDILFRLMRENRMSFVSQYTVPYKLGLIILSPYQLYDIIRSKMYKPEPNVFRIKTYQYYPTWWRYKYNIYLSSDGKDWFLLQKNKIGQVIEVELPPKGNWQLQFERFELTYDEIPQENLMLKNYTVEQLNEYFKEIEEVSLNVETEI